MFKVGNGCHKKSEALIVCKREKRHLELYLGADNSTAQILIKYIPWSDL